MWLINLLSGIFLFLLGFFIKIFKMSFLIAGYNTASKKEKRKYDEKKLVSYIGNLLIISSVFLLLPVIFHFIIFSLEVEMFFASWMFFIIFTIAGVIYVNLSGCTKKSN
jgi:drug/metabolite transporter (DMT)-like permease